MIEFAETQRKNGKHVNENKLQHNVNLVSKYRIYTEQEDTERRYWPSNQLCVRSPDCSAAKLKRQLSTVSNCYRNPPFQILVQLVLQHSSKSLTIWCSWLKFQPWNNDFSSRAVCPTSFQMLTGMHSSVDCKEGNEDILAIIKMFRCFIVGRSLDKNYKKNSHRSHRLNKLKFG